MTTWQYDLVVWGSRHTWHGVDGDEGVRMMLEKFGTDGWELTSTVAAANDALWFVFKRPTSN